MRISSLTLLALTLAGCGEADHRADTNVLAAVEANAAAAAADDGRILCARDRAPLERDCTLEQAQEDRGLVLTLRHPDGGFHRLLVMQDGRGVVAADGAEAAAVSIVSPREIDVAVGPDRYRLPATIRTPS